MPGGEMALLLGKIERIKAERDQARKALAMLWDHYLLPISDETC